MTNVAIFASGNGTNCENIIRYFKDSPDINIVLTVCNKAGAKVLERASGLGVPVAVVTRSELQEPGVVLPLLDRHGVDFIVLAGFLLVVPDYLINAYDHRMINLHPALLPSFGGPGMYGHHVHEAVKAAGETRTGMTVHWVDSVVDGGEIIAQFSTPIAPDDSPEDIAKKEHVLEMEHFPRVIEEIIKGLQPR
ncbi:MAG: phosphoribosylglycinamide formyltransferase [Bacteroidales bacterium]|nr:phosphoribosylglycinamide formyltransferase [Bacteroidales bacterium]